MFFFAPRYVKQGRAFIKDARKMLAYKRDLWSDETVAEFEAGIRKLEDAVRARDKSRVEEAAGSLDKFAGTVIKPQSDAGWRENCEVFLVAIVIALAVRTYFLQPFTIPTGSMQPTLNGIIGYPTKEPPPNILTRIVQKGLYGRTWINVVAETDDVILSHSEVKQWKFITKTVLQGKRRTYTVDCPQDTLFRYFMGPPRELRAGDVIARGYYDTGDHVFVDKFSYHFRRPQRSEVFVFSTIGIPSLNRPGTPSQFYIKRLAGTPGDTLRIEPPRLFMNGPLATEEGFQKVMQGTFEKAQNGYRGYGNGPDHRGWDQQMTVRPTSYLSSPLDSFTVPPKSYFALGDNSYNSQDSRYFGTVPEKNLMGRGVLVYWPFGKHWGRIK